MIASMYLFDLFFSNLNKNYEKQFFHCRYDSLSIYEGASDASPLLGTYCDSSVPHGFISSSNEIFLWFKTDNSDGRKGFQLEYKSLGELFKKQ